MDSGWIRLGVDSGLDSGWILGGLWVDSGADSGVDPGRTPLGAASGAVRVDDGWLLGWIMG